LEILEQRRLLASTPLPFATFSGFIANPSQKASIAMSVGASSFHIPSKQVLLEFVLENPGVGSFSPGRIQISSKTGATLVASSPGRNVGGVHESTALVRASTGSLIVNVSALGGSTGNFVLNVFLAGDVNGDSRVNQQDMNTIKSLIGKRSISPALLVGTDLNEDGKVTQADLNLAEANLNVSTPVRPMIVSTAVARQFDPTGTGIVSQPNIAITGLTEPHASVSLYDINHPTAVTHTTADATGHFQVPFSVGLGLTFVQAGASDAFGQHASFRLTVDRISPNQPTIVIQSPPPLDLFNTNVSISGAVTKTGSIQAQVDSGPIESVSFDSNGHFQFTTALPLDGTADGVHSVHFTAAAKSGTATATAALTFTLDDQPPRIIVTTPANGSVTNNDAIIGTVSDNVSGVKTLNAQVDSSAEMPVTVNAATGTFQFSGGLNLTGHQSDGPHNLTLTAVDFAGNVATAIVQFTINTVPPTVPSFQLAAADQENGVATSTTNAQVTLVGQTDPNITVALLGTGITALTTSTGAFLIPGVPVLLGDNQLTVVATDKAGNTSQTTATIHRDPSQAGANQVITWDQIALQAIENDASTPEYASRGLAIMSASVYDTINSIDGTPGYYVRISAPADSSADAAVATAAYTALSYLYPAQQSFLNGSLTAALGSIANGQSKTDGEAVGQSVANAIIAMRKDDGSTDFVDYTPGSASGDWQPTAPAFAPAENPQWATLEPFAMKSDSQFRPPAPPALSSAEYAAGVNETLNLGSVSSTTRTADETQVALFWNDKAGTYTPPGHWNSIADAVALQSGASLSQDARLFAELNIALADAAIVAWDAKYTYATWRPITLAEGAGTAVNSQIETIANWVPLLTTPAFPEYVSGHSSFSAAAAAVLTTVFGDNYHFSATSIGLPGVTRTFTSFEQAAQEAGMSRIYGGIHFIFSDTEGLTAGSALGAYVLQTFAVNQDKTPPIVTFTTSLPAGATNTNLTITGRVTDNLSGVAALNLSVDNHAYLALPYDPATGDFSFPTTFALNGSQDGPHTFSFSAVDAAGNAASLKTFSFVLATRPPSIAITSPAQGGSLADGATLAGSVTTSGQALAALNYSFDGGSVIPLAFGSSSTFSQALDLSRLTAGAHSLTVRATDAAGNTASQTVQLTLASAIPLVVTNTNPAAGASDISETYRPTITFSRPINPATLNLSDFYAADSTGTKVPATVVSSDDGLSAWLFFTNPLPGASAITITVDGSAIKAADGTLLDAANDGTSGSKLIEQFSTVSDSPVPGTTLSGIVADPGPDNKPGTTDDVKAGPDGVLMTADDIYLNPIAGATVYILGQQNQAVTSGPDGRFTLTSVPSGDVKLVIDGRTATSAPSDVFYPEMVFDLMIAPGVANTVMGSMGTTQEQAAERSALGVYLPRLESAILQPAGGTTSTTIGLAPGADQGLTPDQASEYSITVAPDSLVGADGQKMSSGQVGFSTVQPALIRGMLPQGVMQLATTLTIQAPGVATFSTPLAVTFANVYGAAPGSQLDVYSFNHTTGDLEITGTATVSADGRTVTTDPASGITHPGWFGVTPPGDLAMPPPPPCPPSKMSPTRVAPVFHEEGFQDYFYDNDGTDSGLNSFKLSFTNAALLPDSAMGSCPPGMDDVPMDVHVTVIGSADQFLDGLQPSYDFSLGPGQVASVSAKLKPLLANTLGYASDTMFGVMIEVEAHPDDEPNVNLVPQGSAQIYVYRYLDIADANHTDGILDMPKTAPGVDRQRPVDIEVGGGVGEPTFVVADPTNFHYASLDHYFSFQPQTSDGKMFSTTVQVVDGSGEVLPETLKIEGTPEVQQWTLDIPSFNLALLAVAAGSEAWVGSVPSGLIDTGDERLKLITAAIARATDILQPYSPGLVYSADPTGDFDVVRGKLGTPPTDEDSALAVTSSLVDDQGIINLVLYRDEYGIPEQDFRLSQVLNQSNYGTIDFYLGRDVKEAVKESALGWTAGLSVYQSLVDGLGQMIAHEIGHSVGLVHVAAAKDHTKHINAPDYSADEMWPHADYTGGHTTFPATGNAFSVAVGDEWTPQQTQQALDYYDSYFNVAGFFYGAFDSPPSTDAPPDDESLPIPSGALGVTDSAGAFLTQTGFGNVVLGSGSTAASREILLSNIGGANLTIQSLALAAGVGSAYSISPAVAPGTILAPGGQLALTVTFQPKTSGSQPDTLVIENDGSVPTYDVSLSGTGVSPNSQITVSLPNDDLGGANVGSGGQAAEETATVQDSGSQPLSITSITVAAGSPDYALSGLPSNFPATPIVVAPGATISFRVQFNPAQTGLERGEIDIRSNDLANALDRIHLTGTGLSGTGNDANYGHDYVAIEFPDDSDVTLRTVSDANGNFQFFVPPETAYHEAIFDPISGLIANEYGTTPPSGAPLMLPNPVFVASNAIDTDGDGLPDDVEFAIGTSPTNAYTAGDGIDDFTHVVIDQTNPTGLVPLTTGVVSTVALQGMAQAVALQGSLQSSQGLTAYVATGSYGLAIVDASHFQKPVVLGQVQLQGNSIGVAVDPNLQIAAVASGSFLNLVDVSNPNTPSLASSVDIGASAVAVYQGIAYAASGNNVVAVDMGTSSILATEAFSGGTVDDLGIDQGNLYVLTSDGSTQTISKVVLDGGDLHAPSESLAITGHPPTGPLHLFVANGYLYVGAADSSALSGAPGIEVIRDDGSKLTLVGAPSPILAFNVTANGSGLALYNSANPLLAATQTVYLLDLSDPTNTGKVITSFTTPGAAEGVAIADGLGIIADGSAGLAILNYLPFDTKGKPPSASISLPPSATLGSDGSALKVAEGSTIPVLAAVSDDVQVHNVELLVNGQVVENAVSAPFNLSVVLPTVAQIGSAAIRVQVEAIDTGGNVGLSNTLSLELVRDTAPPQLVSSNVPNGGQVSSSFRTVVIHFSKSLDESSVTAADFPLTAPGGTTLNPENIQFRANDLAVQLTFPVLTLGSYQLSINAPSILGRNGVPLGSTSITSHFTVSPYSAVWINPNGGNWSDPTNWQSGFVPGFNDDVLIDVTDSQGDRPTIAYDSGNTEIHRLVLRNPMVLAGGTLQVDSTVEVDNTFTLDGGTLRDADVIDGTGNQPIVVAGFSDSTLDDVTLHVELNVSQQESANVSIKNGLTLDSTIDLAVVNTLTFSGNQTLAGNGDLKIDSPYGYTLVDFESGTTLTVDPGITIHGTGGIGGQSSGAATIINEGSIIADASGDSLSVDPGSFQNHGTIGAASGGSLGVSGLTGDLGTISLAGKGSSAAVDGTGYAVKMPISISNGTTLDLEGTWSLGTGATITVSAATLGVAGSSGSLAGISLSNATLDLLGSSGSLLGIALTDSTISIQARIPTALIQPLWTAGNHLSIGPGGILDNSGATLALDAATGDLTLAGGTVLGGTVTTNSGSQVVIKGNYYDSGDYSYENTLDGVALDCDLDMSDYTAGLDVVHGLTLNGNALVTNFSALTFAGTTTLGGTGDITLDGDSELDGPDNATMTIGPGITIHGASGSIYGLSPLVNQGTIRNDPNADFDLEASQLTNQGTLSASDGELFVDSPVTNNGTISAGAGGTVSIVGNFQQGPSGIVSISASGKDIDSHGLLVVNAATLAATLDVALVGGYIPAVNDSFPVMTFTTLSGRFSTVNVSNLPVGIAATLVYNSSNATLLFGNALKADDIVVPGAGARQALTPAELAPVIADALARWKVAGISQPEIRRLAHLDFQITNLPGTELGMQAGNSVWIDADAAGHGWFLDATPSSGRAFFRPGLDGELHARAGGRAAEKMDLLTAVEHEMGHVLDLAETSGMSDVMKETLGAGVRRLPAVGSVTRQAATTARWRPSQLEKPLAAIPPGRRIQDVHDVALAQLGAGDDLGPECNSLDFALDGCGNRPEPRGAVQATRKHFLAVRPENCVEHARFMP
jgi:membrane-associated phospholipid phosphatase